MATKQTRKEPQTTIAVNQSVINELDEYLKDKGLSRKEFVEKSIKYFIRTGFDLNSSVSELSPLQNAVADLKELHQNAAAQNDAVLEILRGMQAVQQSYVQKALPAQETAKDAEVYKYRYGKIKAALLQLSENKKAVRIGKIQRIIKEYLDI